MSSKTTALIAACLLTAAGCKEDTTNSSCVEHEDCFDDEICQSHRCQLVYGQQYTIMIESARYLPTSNPDGGFWDPLDGDDGQEPDPYAVFYDLDGTFCSTSRITDYATPTWGQRCPGAFTVEEDSLYGWSIYDDDDGTDDELMAGTADGEEFPIQVEWVRSGQFDLQAGNTSITFGIAPR